MDMSAYEKARENYYRAAAELAGAVSYPARTGGDPLPDEYLKTLTAKFAAADADWEKALSEYFD